MLCSLSVRNVVLIDRLDLEMADGLSVLTGETGSGKSILLDALGLAIGVRADSDLVRQGAEQAVVAAEFTVPDDHPVAAILKDNGFEDGEGLILRRTLGTDGRSRAFINDQPVGVGLLRQVGELLVEVHGQFEAHGLLNPASHTGYLDAYGGLQSKSKAVSVSYRSWSDARAEREKAEQELSQTTAIIEELRQALGEFDELDPQPGEEQTLAARRGVLMHREQLITAMNDALAALNDGKGVDGSLRTAAQILSRSAEIAGGRLDTVLAALDRAVVESTEALAALERASADLESDEATLESVEERLFALRGLARKHQTQVADLPTLRQSWAERLAGLESQDETMAALRKAEQDARNLYIGAAETLSKARKTAAKKLDKHILGELAPLMLDGARFDTRLTSVEEPDWGARGMETVGFEVQTNPNTAAGPIHKVASGGELARLTLALKVVLADAYAPPTVIFDEIDAGIGGAAAAAVGERLSTLSADHQVLVITHSPQVAARGQNHWRIRKQSESVSSRTDVEVLSHNERTDEIARMLAGSEITDEARAAADQLLTGKTANEVSA